MGSMVPRRSADDWKHIVDRYRRSGKTAKAFAAAEGLNASTLAWWCSQLRHASLAFVEVRVEAEPLEPIVVELAGTGHLIRVPPAFDPDHLRRVVAALC